MKIWLFVFLSGILLNSYAQEIQTDSLNTRQVDSVNTGFVRFLVDVDNGYFEIVVDDSIYLKRYKCALLPGSHTAKVWSPGYVINEVDFVIEKGKTIETYVPMAVSNGRQDFERDYRAYRNEFHKALTLPLSASLALGLTSGAFMTMAYVSKQKVYDDIDLYYSAPTYHEAIALKNSIAENNHKYNLRRIGFYTTLGLTVGAIGTTFFTYHRFKKRYEEPRLYDPSPFEDRFSLGISPFGCVIKWNFG